MVTLQNKRTGEQRTWATDNADIVARLVRRGWVVVDASPSPAPVVAAPVAAAPLELTGRDGGQVVELLRAAGYTTLEQIRAASDESLLAINGIGARRLADIRTAVG